MLVIGITSGNHERAVNTMYSQETLTVTEEQEKEIINILIDSSLYLDMPLIDRKSLLNFILARYCQPCDLTDVKICETAEKEHYC